ncbi:DUF4166 domain-containing protein [Mycetocola zhujimingii]|uniref:DUF4166 domain-containing protein n=1 Tax=Mycetocola zhujimingii TaxID=2079792 RepID=A0A2U1TGP3_9MICO|nr:DUF4166 domain-containing protein [Mycetocola zhujimingii]PWC07953.1 DUF4166 domain-containing protein [Mycetocola zhujimingii]
MPATSVYQAALGPDFPALHPRLHAYFSAIPAGAVGTGSGVFDVVGTPKRWLWPALWVLGLAGVLFPVWQHNVPFTVENRSRGDGAGSRAVTARRRFHLTGGDRFMTDVMRARNGELVDSIGSGGLVRARFSARVVDGGLVLRSTHVAVRLGRLTLPIPARLSPVVVLSEQFDDDADAQRVRVTIDAPGLGRLYEYGGNFTYSVAAPAPVRPSEPKEPDHE